MVVGILQIELFVPESGSLKSKRFVLRSLKDRLKNKFNVSVAEVDGGDKWQRSTLGIAAVSNDAKFLESVLRKALDLVYGDHHVQVIDSTMEFL